MIDIELDEKEPPRLALSRASNTTRNHLGPLLRICSKDDILLFDVFDGLRTPILHQHERPGWEADHVTKRFPSPHCGYRG